MFHRSDNLLPEHWTRPRPDCQRTLFPQPTDEALVDLRVTRSDVRAWHTRGWISFDVDAVPELDRPEQQEVEFIRSLALSGLGECQIERLLAQLPHPFSFDPSRVAYHFSYGWVVPVYQDPDDIIAENLSTWIEGLSGSDGLETLRALAAQIGDRIEEMGGDDLGEEESEQPSGQEV